jgi:hypothetical protein
VACLTVAAIVPFLPQGRPDVVAAGSGHDLGIAWTFSWR